MDGTKKPDRIGQICESLALLGISDAGAAIQEALTDSYDSPLAVIELALRSSAEHRQQVSPSQKSRHEKALKSGMRRSFSWVFKSAREASCESCAQAARAARAAAKAAGDSQPRAECGLTVL